MIVLRPVFIIAIVAVAMIGVMVPVTAFGQEYIPLKLELEKNDFTYSDSIVLKIIPEREIPNTNFSLTLVGEDGIIYDNNYKNRKNSYNLLVEKDYFEIGKQNFVKLNRSDMPSQKYTATVVYGNNLGTDSISFNYDNSIDVTMDFMLKNYKINEFVIGAGGYEGPFMELWETGHKVYSIWWDEGWSGQTYKTTSMVEYYLYENTKLAEEIFQPNIDFLLENGYELKHIILDNTNTDYIPKNFSCYNNARDNSDLDCIHKNLIIKLIKTSNEEEKAILNFIVSKGLPPNSGSISSISTNYENTNYERTGEVAAFVDQSKDPQHYIDRYNNEPAYKEWFDENYPQYSSIYEAVGLDESFIEPTVTVESTVIDTDLPICGSGVTGQCQRVQTEESVVATKESSEEGGGCLIATATYGSELAPQVQQLRELRDNQLLQTESGSAFMGTFNDIYYSFSPVIADYERENPYFKEAVKLAITPMISSLSLMENAESESEVLGIGISVIMLNLGMYLGVPAVVVIGIKKIK
jgi:hypothetical protein